MRFQQTTIFILNCEIAERIGHHHLDKKVTSKTFQIVDEDEEVRLNSVTAVIEHDQRSCFRNECSDVRVSRLCDSMRVQKAHNGPIIRCND